MRVAHFTDIHVRRPLRLAEIPGKRLLGAANLAYSGRGAGFSDRVVEALARAVLDLSPDVVVCTGDLTALATRAEFEAAWTLLSPIFERFPFVLVPGNHDAYTSSAARKRPIERTFGAFTGGGAYPAVHRFGYLSFVGVDSARFHPIFASGRIPGPVLSRLGDVLREDDAPCQVLLVHHPLLRASGEPATRRTRDLVNRADLLSVLASADRLGLILHGHEHRGYRGVLSLDGRTVPVVNPGSGGLERVPEHRRTAHVCVYTLAEEGLIDVERHAFDGQAFVPEPGGAFASGW
ncbi:MAG: metallophosphoesterase [Deltaproteobacteria bacterium]|nr:metallophosphoesterase [Deltaproteobacteria bacterium]